MMIGVGELRYSIYAVVSAPNKHVCRLRLQSDVVSN